MTLEDFMSHNVTAESAPRTVADPDPVAGRGTAPADAAPTHLAMVLDGNRRWAAARSLTPVEGHRVGARRLFEVVQWSEDAHIEILTLWVLSAGNLRRPADELAGLLPLIAEVIDGLAARQRWRIRHLGRPDILPHRLRQALRQAVHRTRNIHGMTVNMAVGYDGRAEIADAVRELVLQQAAGAASQEPTGRWEELIAARLDTRGQHDPDLIIRTSGEQRLSGFLLWQCAWSEFYFCPTPWPAFTRADFDAALRSYVRRQRRYGH